MEHLTALKRTKSNHEFVGLIDYKLSDILYTNLLRRGKNKVSLNSTVGKI